MSSFAGGGGGLGASAPGQLEKQVTNIRMQQKGKCSGKNVAADDLFVVMQRAHAEDPSSRFVHAIQAAPDPAVVIANDYKLNDLNRFCTSSSEFGILTVDPTFTLGDFDVTPVTYHHFLLETKIHPSIFGSNTNPFPKDLLLEPVCDYRCLLHYMSAQCCMLLLIAHLLFMYELFMTTSSRLLLLLLLHLC